MSYEKQTWANGDVITADKLNHMEDGIAGGSSDDNLFVVTISEEGTVASSDKTWREITTAFNEGKKCIYVWDQEGSYSEEGVEYTTITRRSGSIINTNYHETSVEGQLTEGAYSIYLIYDEYNISKWDASDPDSPIQYSFD